MAVLGCRRNPQAHTTEECMKCEFKKGMCDVYRVAEKILENNVVLTFDEWINFNKDHANELIKAREEDYELGYKTACREIAQELFDLSEKWGGGVAFYKQARELAEKYKNKAEITCKA